MSLKTKIATARTLGLRGLYATAMVSMMSGVAHASKAASGKTLPFESPADTFVKAITGPIAGGIALLAIVGSGAALIMNGEMGDFARRMFLTVIVIAVIVGAASLLSGLGITAAVI